MLVECLSQSFQFRVGDPTFLGWSITIAYFWVAWRSAGASKFHSREAMFWGILAVFLFCLGINKQLDLQSGLTATGRCVAKAQGWYENRRSVQIAFITAILVIATACFALLAYKMRASWSRISLALTGLAFLLSFVAIRALSFHHVDVFLREAIIGLKLRYFLEACGIGMIAANTRLARRHSLRHFRQSKFGRQL